ncbi:fimbrial biogenesis outer membrane usher protein [Enterobacter sp. Ap-1006]|uniref:fimbria/pilus outer membrane usher protein n=1 Tax=Enterobacter sp. Ap-1006 TaxID=2608345 RepID=UPI00141FD932|nr:fimbria/pilus outer membrane usher protein [Enterobacter sp. Ap-1006]NIF47408.1 fimbrial biogenesis outer membrane usher protein [Enterobacter sp. Ap-1006]
MKPKNPSPKLLSRLVSLALLAPLSPAFAEDYFDPAFLTLNGVPAQSVDLSVFSTSGKVPPGNYVVTVKVNRTDMGQHAVDFAEDTQGNVVPQLTPVFLREVGVNTQGLEAFRALEDDKATPPIGDLIEHASARFNFAKLELELSIPQVAMQPSSRGVVDPELWDHGVPALLLNYSLNGSRSSQPGGSENTNLYASTSLGANLHAWRLRSNAYWTRSVQTSPGQAGQSYQHTDFSNTYLMRDIAAWRSELLAGESSTSGDVLDSVPFRGVKLSSSDEMLPYVQRGFAPVIEGIAQSNARVTVMQNGSIVYQTYVAPGPFRIDDLNQTGQAGELTLYVTEADGTVHSQTIAISSVPVMRRPGRVKYEVTAGRYNGGITVGSREAEFVQGTAILGLPYDFTLYGGALTARDYFSLVTGAGVSLGKLGAVSADVTASRAKIPGMEEQQKGESYRLRYAKSMLSTGTTIDLAAYRYSTSDYYSFSDYNSLGYQLKKETQPWALARARSTFQLYMSQQLGGLGSVFVSAARNDYWGKSKVRNTLSTGYNGSYRGVSYGLAYTIDRTRGDGNWPENRQLAFNMMVPFSLFSASSALNRIYATYQTTRSNTGQVQQMAGLSGSALDSSLSWGVRQGWSNQRAQSDSTSLNGAWSGSKGSVSAGYSQTSGTRSLNLSGSGGLVIHPGGVTLSRSLGSSVAIVHAPGAEGTRAGVGGTAIDGFGYAVVPYLSDYQANNISLDPSTLPDDVDLTHSSNTVYPTKGAVVMTKFNTRLGYQALITLQHAGAAVPFGTTATLVNTAEGEPISGIVGDAGQVYMSGLPEQGSLLLKWGQQATQQCRASFNLKNQQPSTTNPVRSLTAVCQ